MKAVLTDERFSDPDWIFERKLDGIRCIAIRDGGPVKLLSRNDLPLNGRYPEIAAALEAEPCERFAVDGEVIAFEGRDQLPGARGGRGAFYYVFDIPGWTARTCAAGRCSSARRCCDALRSRTRCG